MPFSRFCSIMLNASRVGPLWVELYSAFGEDFTLHNSQNEAIMFSSRSTHLSYSGLGGFTPQMGTIAVELDNTLDFTNLKENSLYPRVIMDTSTKWCLTHAYTRMMPRFGLLGSGYNSLSCDRIACPSLIRGSPLCSHRSY